MDKNQKKAEASKNIYDKQTKNVKTKDINLNRKKEEIIIFQFLELFTQTQIFKCTKILFNVVAIF